MKMLRICSLTMIIAFALAQSDWYPCSKCLCRNSRSDINCHGVVIIQRPPNISIDCTKNENEKTDYSLLWEIVGNTFIESIVFINCSLPDGGLFNGITQLKELVIMGNANLKLTDDFFKGTPNLEYLELDVEEVHLSPDVFKSLAKLYALSIITKHKLIVPDGIFKHSNLVNLVLRQEHVTSTNEKYNTPSVWPADLQYLNISGTFPVSGTLTYHYLKDQHKLRTLEMSQLNITDIEYDAFEGTPNIKTLIMRRNQLSKISSFVFRHLKTLENFDLSENRISSLDLYTSSSFENVNYLNLNYNRLKEFYIFGPISLKTLEINNNLLESLVMRSMIYLDASYNRLTENSFHQKQLNVTIEYLNISHNSIQKIKFIDNKMRSVDMILYTQQKFTTLDLSFNDISTISANDMNFLGDVAKLTHMKNNPITNIIKPQNVDKYSTIDVEGVSFDCSCSIYDLVQYLKRDEKPMNIIIGNSTCSSPLYMRGRYLKDLQVCDVVCDDILICPESCQCYQRPCDNAILATCSLQTTLVFPPEISKLELTIQNSTFDPHLIDEATFQKVTKLFIAKNNILTLTVQHVPDNIQSLDLRNNYISHVGEEVVNKLRSSSSLKSINISGNKIVCDCDNRELLTFIQSNSSIFQDIQNEKCYNEKELIRLVSITDLCGYRKALTIVGIVVAIVAFIIITCIALYYKYQTEFKVWLFAKGWFVSWVTEEEIDKDKVYDAFLAWSHKDDEFVLNEILSKLEEGPNPFKICVHYRDWEVGEMINTQINRSIKQSRRTLVVLTPNFLKSPWGMYEFKQAHCYALEESRVRVIVICHGDLGPREQLDPDLQAYLATRTYIEWGDARFWEKLIYALPHATGRADLDGTFYYRSGMVHFRRRA